MKHLILVVVLAYSASFAPAQNLVFNDTGQEHVEQMVRTGMDSLQIKRTVVFIFDESSMFTRDDMTENKIYGYLMKRTGHYIIAINFEMTTETRLPKLIAHELIHLHQHVTKRLVNKNDSITVFKGRIYNRNELPYSLYPWEIEAFKYQRSLAKAIKQ